MIKSLRNTLKNAMQEKEVKDIKQEIVYKSDKNTVRRDIVTYKDGRQEIHEVLESPEGVLVLPVMPDGNIILTKEYRHNHGWTYGVPMGKKETVDIDPLGAAKRELEEELGISASRWSLTSTHHNGVHEEGLNYFFVAEELSHGKNILDTDESIEKLEVTFEDAFKLMDEDKIIDLTSRACIWAGYIFLQNRVAVPDSNNSDIPR